MSDIHNRPEDYYGPFGSFEGIQPEVDITKVQEYVDWKRSYRHRAYEYIMGPHRVWAWPPGWRLHSAIRRWASRVYPEVQLNRIELIRAGLLLRQYHRARCFWCEEWSFG